MRKEFGTPYIEKQNIDSLLEESKLLLPSLLSINLDFSKINNEDYENIVRLFEIVKFAKERYPYLLILEFEGFILNQVKIYQDPLYENNNQNISCYSGRVFSYPDLLTIANNPNLLIKTFDTLLNKSIRENTLKDTVCISGADFTLNIGNPNACYFNENLEPIYILNHNNAFSQHPEPI